MISHMLWTGHFFSHMVSPGKKKNAQGKVLRFQNKAGFHTSRSITLLSNFTLYFVTGPSVTLCLYRAPQDDNFCIFWFCMSYLRLQRRLSGQWDQADTIIMSFSSKNYKHNNDDDSNSKPPCSFLVQSLSPASLFLTHGQQKDHALLSLSISYFAQIHVL